MALQVIEAENMKQRSGSFGKYSDPSASGGQAIAFQSDGTLQKQVLVPQQSDLIVRGLGVECNAAQASMIVEVDGVTVGTELMYASPWKEFTYAKVIPAGKHAVTIKSANSYVDGTCIRQVKVDSVAVR